MWLHSTTTPGDWTDSAEPDEYQVAQMLTSLCSDNYYTISVPKYGNSEQIIAAAAPSSRYLYGTTFCVMFWRRGSGSGQAPEKHFAKYPLFSLNSTAIIGRRDSRGRPTIQPATQKDDRVSSTKCQRKHESFENHRILTWTLRIGAPCNGILVGGPASATSTADIHW